MNLSSRLEQLKQQRKASKSGEQPTTKRSHASAVRTWIALGLCLVFAGVGTLAALEFFIWNNVPPELVGLWEVEDGPQKGSTFEFSRDGSMEVRLKNKKKFVTHRSEASVTDRTLRMTVRDPLTRSATTNESTIRELTADSLILELERGDVLKMVRLE